MREITRDIVVAMIFSKDGKLFLGMKDPKGGGVYPDCWHIPGGGINQKEGDRAALIREIKEETGIDISVYKIELIDDKGKGEAEKTIKETREKVLCKMNFRVYKVVIKDKVAEDIKVSLDDDLKTYAWVDIKELKKYKLTPSSKELFKVLGYI